MEQLQEQAVTVHQEQKVALLIQADKVPTVPVQSDSDVRLETLLTIQTNLR